MGYRRKTILSLICVCMCVFARVGNSEAIIDDPWNLFVDNGEAMGLSGYHKYFSKIEIAGKVFIDPGIPLILEAPQIIIQPTGFIIGDGKGCQDPPKERGACGAPLMSLSEGGGGYGGRGGDGCCCIVSWEPCPGGNGGGGGTSGTVDGYDIDMGSCGGGWYSGGGKGGGCVTLLGLNSVTVSGTVTMNGNSGSFTMYAGGGGSGGGIKIMAPTVLFRGLLSVKGGGAGTSPAVPYGGSGGGGRIKIFYTTAYHDLGGTMDVSPGWFYDDPDYCSYQGEPGTIHIEHIIAVPTVTSSANYFLMIIFSLLMSHFILTLPKISHN